MAFQNLIDAVPPDGRQITLPDAAAWMQGRTLFGGASTALAHAAARSALPDLPPLRAAQVGFVAPVGEHVRFAVQIVREGRNVTQVRSEIICDDALALTTLMLFGASRPANAVHPAAACDRWPGAPETAEPDTGSAHTPHFVGNFDLRHGQPKGLGRKPVLRRWVRLRDRGGLDPVTEVLVLGDALPPSAVRAMQRPGPLSSINWSFNLLDPSPATRDGWYLAETASDHADGGYSSERLRLWNADGQQILAGMQTAAIFG